MAIQNRRGIYSDFDPTKMVEGEFAVVQSGDPNTSDGKAVYIAPTTGTAERVALYKDLQQEVQAAITDATDEVIQEVTAGIIEGVAEDVTKAETAATNAETSAQNAEASAEEAQEVLENKVDNNGYYPDLYAGNLSSTRKQTDSIPYLMRKTGGSLSRIGEREHDTLVGATVNVNQLVNLPDGTRTIKGITTVRSDGVKISYSGTTTDTGSYIDVYAYTDTDSFLTQFIAGHRYLIRAISSDNKLYTVVNKPYTDMYGANRREVIYTPSETPSYFYIRVLASNGETVNGNGYLQIIDLTAKFGSTIADYLYSLEQTTVGAGIAKLREWGFLTDEYIPYNAGSLESVEATAHKIVRFNQWDEEWEVGAYNSATGAKTDAVNDRIRSKNLIPMLPSTTYYKNKGLQIYWYDANRNFVNWNSMNGPGTFTTPNYCHYITFNGMANSGNTYNHDICINLSNPDRNGEYEPYKANTYDLGTDTLRGLFKLDSNNKLYADGDTKTSDGVITRKYGVVDLGTLSWSQKSRTPGVFYSWSLLNVIKQLSDARLVSNIMCSALVSGSKGAVYDNMSIDNAISAGYQGGVYVHASNYSTVNEFATAMSGVYLVYELATPTTEQSTPFTNPQICDPDGTEEYMTSNGVPVGHVTEYDYNIKGLAEELIDVPDVPSSNGTYVLKATRSASGISYEWVSYT